MFGSLFQNCLRELNNKIYEDLIMNNYLNVRVLESELKINSATSYFSDSPYRGLEPFRYVDSPIFFARANETRKLLRYVTIYRGVLFYGDSGAGKSSLINAGLIPELIEEGFTPDRIRVQPEKDNELIIERIPQTANGQPPYLPSNFADNNNLQSMPSRVVLPVKGLKERFENVSSDKLRILIFDQFEEIVTLFEEARVGKNLEESLELQKSILDVLVDIISDQTLPVKLLFVFREDYLAKLNKFFVHCPDITDQFLRLTPPSIETLNTIISGPFAKFPNKFGNEFSDELITKLEIQLEERSEANTLNLSEVQVACLELWQSNAPDALLEERKVEGLLEDFLNESLNTLPKDLREVSVALLRRMVTTSGTRNVVSEDDLISSVKKEGFKEDKIKKSLDALTYQTKLVRRERRHDTFFYQIVSEFLVPWIRRQQQEQNARAERSKVFRIAGICIGIALLIAIAMGGVAYWVETSRTIDARVNAAETAAALAEEEKENAIRVARDETESKEKALQELGETSNALGKVQADKASLQNDITRLRGILDNDSSKADIASLFRERDQYRQASMMAKEAEQRAEKFERLTLNYLRETELAKTNLDSLTEAYKSALSKYEVLKDNEGETQGKLRIQLDENKRLRDENERLNKLVNSTNTNSEIEELKNKIVIKDKEIDRLNKEIKRLNDVIHKPKTKKNNTQKKDSNEQNNSNKNP